MSIVAPQREQERKDAERDAWLVYRERLRDLDGSEYESAEDASWDELQGRLQDIAREFSPQG